MQVEDNNGEEALILKSKRPRITLEPYDERKVEVIHDDGQEIYEPVPTLSEKFLQVVHKVREQQQQEQQQAQQKAEAADATTTPVVKIERPLSHFIHMARVEVEFMGHTLDMIRDGFFMLPQSTKAQNVATTQVNELAVPLEGKKAALIRAAERIRNAATNLQETITKDHEGYLPHLLALRSRWRFHSTATPTPYGISLKIAVDYGHTTVGGPPPPPNTDPPEAYVTRDDGSLELSFKKNPDTDLHFVLSVPQEKREGEEGGEGVERRRKEVVVSARSLSAVQAEGQEGEREREREREKGATKFMKSVRKLIRAHECQFNEEMFQKIVSEIEQKEDKRITRSTRLIEEAIHIDSGHYGSGASVTIRKGTEGNYSHNNPPERHLPQVLLLAARRLYLAQCLHSAQQMQTLTRNGSPSTPPSLSVLGGICDIFLHIDMRVDVISTLEKMAETYPIAVHWTSHGPSKSSCVVRNSHNYNHSNTNTNYNNNNNNNNYNNNINNDITNRNVVDGMVVVYLEGRDITCTIASSTLRVVHPRELVQFIKNYFRFL